MRKKYHIEGIDCANCAAKVEKKMNELGAGRGDEPL